MRISCVSYHISLFLFIYIAKSVIIIKIWFHLTRLKKYSSVCIAILLYLYLYVYIFYYLFHYYTYIFIMNYRIFLWLCLRPINDFMVIFSYLKCLVMNIFEQWAIHDAKRLSYIEQIYLATGRQEEPNTTLQEQTLHEEPENT